MSNNDQTDQPRARDRISRLRASRASAAAAQAASVNVSDSAENSPMPSGQSDRKTALQRLRQSRQVSRMQSSTALAVESESRSENGSEDNGGSDASSSINEKTRLLDDMPLDNYEYQPLVVIDRPTITHSLGFTKPLFGTDIESKALVFPRPYPESTNLDVGCARCCQHCSNVMAQCNHYDNNNLNNNSSCCSCCGYPSNLLPRSAGLPAPALPLRDRRDERDFLREHYNEKRRRLHVGDLSRQREERRLIAEHQPDNTNNSNQNQDLESAQLLGSYYRDIDTQDAYGEADDGIFQEPLPLYAPLLLRGEDVLPLVAKLSMANSKLSRVSQRILREVKLLVDQLGEEKGLHAIGNRDMNDADLAQQSHLHRLQRHYQRLFHQNFQHHPLGDFIYLRAPHDPLDYSFTTWLLDRRRADELLLGHRSNAHRALLADSNRGNDGGGPLSGSPAHLLHNRNPEFLLKIFLLHVSFQDHPFMNGEERAYATLKDSFAQYTAMFQQKHLEYLANRVASLAESLQRLTSLTRAMSEEETVELQCCVKDVTIFVPYLSEAAMKIHALSKEVYGLWKEVQTRRRQQGFTTTSAYVKARRVTSIFVDSDHNHNRDDDTQPPSAWREYKRMLQTLVAQFRAALLLLRGLNNAATGEPNAVNSSQTLNDPLRTSYQQQPHQAPANFSLTPLFTTESEARRAIESIDQAVNRLQETPGLFPEVLFQLSDSGIPTSDTLITPREVMRRRILQELTYYLQVRINGQLVMTTADLHIKPPPQMSAALGLDVRRYYEVQLQRIPTSLDVMLYCRRPRSPSSFLFGCFNRDYLVARVAIPLPKRQLPPHLDHEASTAIAHYDHAQYTHNFVPVSGAFAFASAPLPEMHPLRRHPLSTGASATSTTGLCCCTPSCVPSSPSLCGACDGVCGNRADAEAVAATGSVIAGHVFAAVDFDPLTPLVRKGLQHAAKTETSADVNSSNNNQKNTGSSNTYVYDGSTAGSLAVMVPGPSSSSSSAPSSFPGAAGGAATGGLIGFKGAAANFDFTREQDFQQLLPWLQELDVNDPKNDHLLYVKAKRALTGQDGLSFHLYGLDAAAAFTSLSYDTNRDILSTTNHLGRSGNMHILNTNGNNAGNTRQPSLLNFAKVKVGWRLRLLQLRVQKPYLVTLPVPLVDRLIRQNEVLRAVLQKEELAAKNQRHLLAAQDPLGQSLREVDDDDVEVSERSLAGKESVNLAKVTSFLTRVRNSQTAQSRKTQKRRLWTSSIVIETDYFPTILAGVEYVESFLMQRKRALKPRPKGRVAETMEVEECTVLVQVVGARNVPVRVQMPALSSSAVVGGVGGATGVRSSTRLNRSTNNLRNSTSNANANANSNNNNTGDEEVPLLANNNTNNNNNGNNNNNNTNNNAAPPSPVRDSALRRQLLASMQLETNANAGSLLLGNTLTNNTGNNNNNNGLNANANLPNNGVLPDTRQMLDTYKLRLAKRVHSFVEVRFQEHLLATVALDGSMPLWKQSLALPFLPPQRDFSPQTLEQVREEVYFTLFDEVVEDDAERGGFLDGENTLRTEKYYLGSFSVPFTTIYREGKLEGLFRIELPLINVGYSRPRPVLRLESMHADARRRLQDPNNVILTGTQGPDNPADTALENAGDLSETLTQQQQPLLSPVTNQPPPLSATINQNDMRTVNIESLFSSLCCCVSFCCLICVDCFPCVGPVLAYLYEVWRACLAPWMESRVIVDVFAYESQSFPPKTQVELTGYLQDDDSTYLKTLLTLQPLLPSSSADTSSSATHRIVHEVGGGGGGGGGRGLEDFSPASVAPEDHVYALYAQSWLDALHHTLSFLPNTTMNTNNQGTSAAATMNNNSARRFNIFATNSQGLQIFLCRYLTPQAPPPDYPINLRSLLHLVSLLPFMKDAQSFLGSLDLWCTNREFWEIGAGDEEEHAVLLYNYLRYLLYPPNNAPSSADANDRHETENMHRQSHHRGSSSNASNNNSRYPSPEEVAEEALFLVLGNAVPEGQSVYVLLRDRHRRLPQDEPQTNNSFSFPSNNQNNQKKKRNLRDHYHARHYLVLHPVSGQVYAATDPHCPLKDIFVLATPYNLWANIQPSTRPQDLCYDVQTTQRWRPFFGSRCRYPSGGLRSLQPRILYTPTEPAYAQQIEESVFTAVRNGFRRWRSKRMRSTTTFHPQASAAIQELLLEFEQWKRNSPLPNLDNLLATYYAHNTNTNTINNNNNSSTNRHTLNVDVTGLDRIEQQLHTTIRGLVSTRQRLRGFPVNVAFTDVDEIVARIKTFCVHETSHPAVQFVLAVRAVPLYNNLVSLWIFVGSLEATNPALT